MFAVLKTGGKQYRVSSGDILRVEKLAADAGDTIQFNDVLMVDDQVGSPLLIGAAVQATVIDQIKGDKTIHFVRRRRKHSSKRTKGHRQQLTLVRVTDILATGGDATGVKAAIGTGFREPQVDAPRAGAASTLAAVAATATETLSPVAGTVRSAARRAVPVVEEAASDVVTAATGIASAVSGAIGAVLGAAATAAVGAIPEARRDDAAPDADEPDATASDATTKE